MLLYEQNKEIYIIQTSIAIVVHIVYIYLLQGCKAKTQKEVNKCEQNKESIYWDCVLFWQPSPLPEYAYMDTKEGRRLHREMTGFGILMQSQQKK